MYTSLGIPLASIAILVLLMAGCAAGPTHLENTYGTAYHVLKAAQTLHSEATAPRAPAHEFDGKAAKYLLERYRTTFEKPPPPPSFVISVGGIK